MEHTIEQLREALINKYKTFRFYLLRSREAGDPERKTEIAKVLQQIYRLIKKLEKELYSKLEHKLKTDLKEYLASKKLQGEQNPTTIKLKKIYDETKQEIETIEYIDEKDVIWE